MLTFTALIAALYTALCFTVPFFSFGAVQFRLSEALTVLPLFFPPSVWGLAAGCFLSNLLGFFTGLNPIGLIDCAAGTAATLIAALLTYLVGRRIKKKWPRLLLGLLPPVLVNAIIVGAELMLLFYTPSVSSFLFNFLWVGLGQLVVCYALGLPLGLALSKDGLSDRLFYKNSN